LTQDTFPKRVPTSLFPFKRGQFDVCLDGWFLFWHHQPLGVSLPRLGVGLGNWKSMHILVYCGGEYVEYTRIHVACLCGSLIGYKRRSKLKQAPTNYKKVKKEPR